MSVLIGLLGLIGLIIVCLELRKPDTTAEEQPCPNCGQVVDDAEGDRRCPVCKRRYDSLSGGAF